MKIKSRYLVVLLLTLLVFPLQINAQETRKESEREVQREIEKQKRDQRRELEQLQREMLQEQREQKRELEEVLKSAKGLEEDELKAILEQQQALQEQAMDQYSKAYENYAKKYKEMEKSAIWHNFDVEAGSNFFGTWDDFPTPIVVKDGGFQTAYLSMPGGESTSLNIRKDLENVTFSTQFKYVVQEGSNSFQFSASGSVDGGTIQIKLLNPEEDAVHEFEVSPLADVQWSQRLKWSEEEADEYIGTWTIIVAADEATGNYQVNVRAN